MKKIPSFLKFGSNSQQSAKNKVKNFFFERQKPSSPSKSVSQNYVLCTQKNYLDRYFEQLADEIFNKVHKKNQKSSDSPPLMPEKGEINSGRKYLFIQLWDEDGLLFEQIETGFLIVNANKIVSTGTFMREFSPIEISQLYMKASEESDDPSFRVRSQWLPDELISLPLYFGLMWENLMNRSQVN